MISDMPEGQSSAAVKKPANDEAHAMGFAAYATNDRNPFNQYVNLQNWSDWYAGYYDARVAADDAPEWDPPANGLHALFAQEGYQNPIAQVAFRAGFLLCREYMARFVEQGGDKVTAQSVRLNWLPDFGADPGPPRRYDFSELVDGDDLESGPWTTKNPGVCVDAAVYAFSAMAEFGLQLPDDSLKSEPCEPAFPVQVSASENQTGAQ